MAKLSCSSRFNLGRFIELKQELAQLTAETERLEKAYTKMRDEEKRQGAVAALCNQVLDAWRVWRGSLCRGEEGATWTVGTWPRRRGETAVHKDEEACV